MFAVYSLMICHAVCAQSASQQQTENATKQVLVTGIGITPQSAEKQAITDAVRQAVGAYVDANTIVENEAVIQDRILSVSSGFVQEYKVIAPAKKRDDGLYELRILAMVQTGQVLQALKENSLLGGELAGSDLWAEASTKATSAEDSLALLQAKMPDFCRSLIKLRLFDKSGAPVALSDGFLKSQNAAQASTMWFVGLSVDSKTYFESFAPIILKCMSNITGSSGEKFKLHNPKRREFFKGDPGGASEYFGKDVPFRVPFSVFADEILGPDKKVIYDRTVFIVEKASRNLDYLEGTMFRSGECQSILKIRSQTPWAVSVELLDEEGRLLAKGVTPIREPFSLREKSDYELPKGALSQVGPFVYTEAYSYEVIGVDPVYPVKVDIPLEALKEVKRVECKIEMPSDFQFFLETADAGS